MPALAGVLLDVDGTLIDSNDAHARSWTEVLRAAGFDVSFADVRPLIGMGGDKLLPRLTGLDHESERARELTTRRAALFKSKYLPHLRAFPCAHELLHRMHEAKLRLVIATSAKEEEMDALLEQTGLNELVQRRTSSSDAEHSKPDPDIVRAALARGKLDAAQVIFLGDTPYDIEAAARARIDTVALRCGGWDDRALSGAVALYDHPADLLAHWDESPFAD